MKIGDYKRVGNEQALCVLRSACDVKINDIIYLLDKKEGEDVYSRYLVTWPIDVDQRTSTVSSRKAIRIRCYRYPMRGYKDMSQYLVELRYSAYSLVWLFDPNITSNVIELEFN